MRARQVWSAVTTTVGAAKTMAQVVANTNHRIYLTEVMVSFNGTDNLAEPVLVEILRQTTAGTMTAGTLVKMNDSDGDTLDSSGQYNATVEPTAGDILAAFYLHPQGGYEKITPEPESFVVGAGDRLGVRVTQAAGETQAKCAGHIEFIE